MKNEVPALNAASKTDGTDIPNGSTSLNGSVHDSSKEHQDAHEVTSKNGRTINVTTGQDLEDVSQVFIFIFSAS